MCKLTPTLKGEKKKKNIPSVGICKLHKESGTVFNLSLDNN
jgi:hypothetical protein